MRLESRVEILKLARLLDAPPERFAYLEEIPPQDLRRLRERGTDRLFDADGQALQRIAAASKLLPTGVAASIGQRAFGPLLCARIAGRLDPGRGVDLAARLPAEFLADVAVELDPRRASEIIVRVPVARIVEITRILVARGEHVAMGRFVGHLRDDAVLAALGVIDDESLLRVVFVLEAKQRVSHVAGLLSDDRLRGLVRAAAQADMWTEALDLIAHLHKPLLRRLAALPEVDDPAVIDPLVRAAVKEGVWEQLLGLVELLPASARARVQAALPARVAFRGMQELDLAIDSGRIHAQAFGPPAAPLILAVHGLSANMHAFDFLAPRILGERRLVSVDLRGRGRSDVTPAGTYGMRAHARDVLQIADRLEAERFDYVGWSMGALIGIVVAGEAPGRLRSVGLIDHAGGMDRRATDAVLAGLSRFDLDVGDAAAYVDRIRELSPIRPFTEFWETLYAYEFRRTGKAACREDFEDIPTHDWPSLWPALTMPTALVRCRLPLNGGFVVPEAVAREIDAAAPGLTLTEVEADHFTVMTDERAASSLAANLDQASAYA